MPMKGKDHTLMKAAASTDLLVCFPSRASISRPTTIFCPVETGNLHRSQLHLPPHLKRTNARGVGVTMSSPLLRGPKTKQIDSENAEPTSPKVTCAGQIKAQSKSNKGCKTGQYLIEEIERIHNHGKRKRKHWLRSLGLKKELGQLLSCWRGLRFDLRLRCLSNFSTTCNDDEDVVDAENNTSNTLFSKWFMVLQENHNYDLCRRHKVSAELVAPPPNALLLMRCRSAPVIQLSAKDEVDAENCTEHKDGGESTRKLRCLMDEEKLKELEDEPTKKKNTYVEMRETWFIARSKSWKR